MGIILFSYSPKLLPAGYDDNIVSQPQSATSASPKRYMPYYSGKIYFLNIETYESLPL